MSRHPLIESLLHCISLEEKEQANRYRLDQQHTLRSLKAEGLALHPLIVTRRSFGYADYPEIQFRLPYPVESNLFRDGSAIECFKEGEEPVKGILLSSDNKSGEFRLFAPDFPDWIEDDGVGIKLAPDTRTSSIMRKTMESVGSNKTLSALFDEIHGERTVHKTPSNVSPENIHWKDDTLNESQRAAVAAILEDEPITIVHGPPGTGKTTTLVEAILQLKQNGEKILVCAPSNTAVDHIARELIRKGARCLRLGNTAKVDPEVFPHTPEGRLNNSRQQKEIRQLKIRAEEFRKMALKYKRNFGKAEREQRNLLFKEVKQIREEIRKLQAYNEEKLLEEAEVLLGTPIGLHDAGLDKMKAGVLVMDEAGQCMEPLAWTVFHLAPRIVLAGDHLQLPPTVLSDEAAKMGLNRSILEAAIGTQQRVYLLNTQYRMRNSIAGFSNEWFYKGLLQTAGHLTDSGMHIHFIDTAGSGFGETQGGDGFSLQNEGELQLTAALIRTDGIDTSRLAFISPYSGQVDKARQQLPAGIRISTIDSFQGQEKEIVIVSLVRSNDESVIGFLKDYRRMNVAMTRAKEQLLMIGDSATLGADPFYRALLDYIERNGSYRTVWEYDLMG